jgi:predicted nucleic acid-binding protein
VIVVTDTSVILNLCLLGLEQALPVIFGGVHAPPAVREEFLRLVAFDPRFTSLEFPSFIQIHAPSSIHPLLLTPRLHRGEAEALSLTVELNATRVLMDERAGRAAAATLGIPCIGLLGILIESRRRNLISSLEPYLDRLQIEARFWFSQTLRLQVLQLAGEIP